MPRLDPCSQGRIDEDVAAPERCGGAREQIQPEALRRSTECRFRERCNLARPGGRGNIQARTTIVDHGRYVVRAERGECHLRRMYYSVAKLPCCQPGKERIQFGESKPGCRSLRACRDQFFEARAVRRQHAAKY